MFLIFAKCLKIYRFWAFFLNLQKVLNIWPQNVPEGSYRWKLCEFWFFPFWFCTFSKHFLSPRKNMWTSIKFRVFWYLVMKFMDKFFLSYEYFLLILEIICSKIWTFSNKSKKFFLQISIDLSVWFPSILKIECPFCPHRAAW